MSFLSKFIKEDTPQSTAVKTATVLNVTPKTEAVDPKEAMMRMVKEMVESGPANDNPASKEGGVLTEALKRVNSEETKPTSTEVKVEEVVAPTVGNPVEEIKAEKPAVEIEIPKSFQPPAPTIVAEVKKAESRENLTEAELDAGREYVKAFLGSLDNYLTAGKEVEKLTKEKDAARSKLDGELRKRKL